MRKIISVLLFLAVALSTKAQEGKWVSETIQGDELKGTETTVAHFYIEEDMGVFIIWDDDNERFGIYSPTKMFASTISNGKNGALATIGLYDNGGNLKEKMKIWMTLDTNSGYKRLVAVGDYNHPLIKGHKKNIKKVLDAVRSGDGYIRIIAYRHQADDFDMKISPIKE